MAALRIAAVILVGVASVVGLGCGQGASQSTNTPADSLRSIETVVAAQQPGATTPAGRTETTLSLHERIMKEQGRGEGASPNRPPATVPAGAGAAPLETSTTIPVDAGSAAAVVLTDGQTPIRGVWSGSADRLASFLLSQAPAPRFTVSASELAAYYVRYCGEAGLRADVLWAQMLLETGYGMYSGDVSPAQNNFAGIGATGGGEPGISFATAEAGVAAQVAHMVAYVYVSSPVDWANSTTDPRFDYVSPRGAASVLADLNGRWAVPGATYGQDIEKIVRAINGG